MQLSFSVSEIVNIVEPRSSRGATDVKITNISSLEVAEAGDLSFLGNVKYRPKVATSRASVLLLPTNYEGEPQAGQIFLLVDNPSAALAKVCAHIERLLWPKPAPGIHPSACVAATAKIAPTATVGPLCVIEDGVVVGEGSFLQAQVFVGRYAVIGQDCWVMPRVVIAMRSQIGNRVRLQPGVVIGSDGFGYELVDGRHERIPQVGIVKICDDVEIGANTTIDRARFSCTTIGEGSKIDNLVQIAHNVTIGKNVILCAQVGISGSTTVEDYVVLAGQVGVAGHLTIGRGVQAGGQTGISSSVEPGLVLVGTPCLPYNLDRRINVLRKHLPEIFKRVDYIEEHLNIKKDKQM